MKVAAFGEGGASVHATISETEGTEVKDTGRDHLKDKHPEYGSDAKQSVDGEMDAVHSGLSEECDAASSSIQPLSTSSRDRLTGNAGGKMVVPIPNLSERSTPPPRKMLKVRPDGKLSSPKAQESLQGRKSKRVGKAQNKDPTSKSIITTIKYGVDDTTRSITGGRIDKILSGMIVGARPIAAEKSGTVRLPTVTHPFFLGGTVHSSDHQGQPSGSGQGQIVSDVNPSAEKRKPISPWKTRVTSKPPNVSEMQSGHSPFGWNLFGSDHARVSRFPGAMEPIWPPHEMLHVGRDTGLLNGNFSRMRYGHAPSAGRKLKNVEVKVTAEEEVLNPCLNLVRTYRNDDTLSKRVTSRDWRQFRRPLRRLLNGIDLQRNVLQRTKFRAKDLDSACIKDRLDEGSSNSQNPSPPIHKAIRDIYEAIATSTSAFDKFECETEEWIHKYAPKTAEGVLQEGRELAILRDWLKGLTVNSVENSGHGTKESSISRKLAARLSERKRKRAEQLDDFVVSSDEEANRMDGIVDAEDGLPPNSSLKKTVVRTGDSTGASEQYDRSANAVVISGPHGCGKTAAVYAVAQELDFEVFEINAGSRRSGRDIMDKVGDMTRNHLVKHLAGEEKIAVKVKHDNMELAHNDQEEKSRIGQQGMMNTFFKSEGKVKKKQSEGKVKAPKTSPTKKTSQKNRQQRKQSLILLEEVDVLFEEDKMFWSTTLALILQSKRPVIMTCTDECLLPLDEMILYAILRLPPPSEQLTTDYLLLLACNEGHLLSRDAVSALYKAKKSDLRASIAELNFFCQMAIGDVKGGLDWMLVRPADHARVGESNRLLRVISEDSYQPAMGWISGELPSASGCLTLCQEIEVLSQAWNGWGVEEEGCDITAMARTPTDDGTEQARSVLKMLQDFDLAAEALSVADTFPACTLRELGMAKLDTTAPKVIERIRSDYTEGSSILLVDPVVDQGGVMESLVFALKACARQILHTSGTGEQTSPLTEQSIALKIPDIIENHHIRHRMTKTSANAVFEPIARCTKNVVGTPKGPQMSCFDGPMSIVAEDLAPYLRNIVSYDIRLEEQRRQLSSQLLGSKNLGKKGRTTRASRAALEGGQKAHTRRERWFPNDTNLELVMQSGGRGWQNTLQQDTKDTTREATGPNFDESRRSSLGSAMGSDL